MWALVLCKHSVSVPAKSVRAPSHACRCFGAVLLLFPLFIFWSNCSSTVSSKGESAENLKDEPIIGGGVAVLRCWVRSVEDGDLRDTEDDCVTLPNAGELLMWVSSHSFTTFRAVMDSLSIFRSLADTRLMFVYLSVSPFRPLQNFGAVQKTTNQEAKRSR